MVCGPQNSRTLAGKSLHVFCVHSIFSLNVQPFFSSVAGLPPVGLPGIDCFLSFLPPRSNSKCPALPASVFSVTAARPAVCFL